MDPIVSQSTTIEHNSVYDDNLAGPGSCGTTPAGGLAGRCGYGPRQPLLVISPYAKQNYVDHQITDQSSVIRFIEDNFLDSARIGDGSTDARAGQLNNMFDFTQTLSGNDNALLLNETTGKPVSLK
jgi:phospholipase C